MSGKSRIRCDSNACELCILNSCSSPPLLGFDTILEIYHILLFVPLAATNMASASCMHVQAGRVHASYCLQNRQSTCLATVVKVMALSSDEKIVGHDHDCDDAQVLPGKGDDLMSIIFLGEHVLIIICLLLRAVIPNVPKNVHYAVQRQKYMQMQTLQEVQKGNEAFALKRQQ